MKQLGMAVVLAVVALFALGGMWSLGSGLYQDFAFLRLARTQYDQQLAQRQAQLAAQQAQQQQRRATTPTTPPAAPTAPAEGGQ